MLYQHRYQHIISLIFGIEPEQLDALLSPHFERIEDAPVDDSIPVFAGRERWQVWQRRP